MRSFLVLCMAAALVSAARAHCDACLDLTCYRKHLLPGATGDYADIDRNTNTLYINGKKYMAQCNLDSGTCRNTYIKWNINSIIVNQHTGNVYGSSYNKKGIYELDLVHNKMVLLASNELAEHITFQNKLYYSGEHDGFYGIFTHEDGVSQIVPGSKRCYLDSFVVDNNSEIYCHIYELGLISRLSKGIEQTDCLGLGFNAMTVDRDGNVIFFKSSNAVYRATKGEPVLVGAVNGIDGLINPMFDRDNNLVCSFSGLYYHYKKESNARCTTFIRQNKMIINEIVVPSHPIDSGIAGPLNHNCNCVSVGAGVGIGLTVVVINAGAVFWCIKIKARTPRTGAPIAAPPVEQQQMIATWDGYYDFATEATNAAATIGLYEEIR